MARSIWGWLAPAYTRGGWLAPMPGEHNEEIFCGLLGHGKDELARWGAEGVV